MAEFSKSTSSSSESLPKGEDFLVKFQQDAARLADDLSQAKRKMQEWESRAKIAESEKNSALQKVESVLKEKGLVENNLREMESSLKQAESRHEATLKAKKELQGKVDELETWQEEAVTRAKSMFSKHEELIGVLEESELSEQNLKRELLEAQQRISRLENFEKDFELLKLDNQKMQKTLNASEQASRQERSEMELEKQRTTHLEQEKNKLNQVLSEKDKGLKETATVLEQTREAMARSQRMAEQAMQELEVKKRALDALQAEKFQQERSLQALKNEQSMLQQTLSANNAAAQKELEQEKIRLSQNLAEKEKGLSQVKSDLDLMREAMARSQKMAEQAMSELGDSRNKSKLLADELVQVKRGLEEERIAVQKRFQDRQQEYQKLQAELTALQIKLDEARENLAKSDREQATAQRKIQSLEDTLATTRELLRAKELELEATKHEIKPVQELLMATQTELNQTRGQLDANNKEVEFIISRMGLLSDRVNPGTGASVASAMQALRMSPAISSAPTAGWPAPAPTFPISRPVAPRQTVSQVSFPSQTGSGVFSMNGINLEQLALVDFPGDVSITIPELLCACFDVNWRAAWLAGQKPEAFRLIPREAPVAAGGHFYEVIEEFIDWLLSDTALDQGAAEWGEQELWKALHDMFLEQRLNSFVAQGQFNETNFLSRRLRSFCQRVTQLRQRTPGFRDWNHVFPSHLIDVPRAVFPMGDCRLVVTGTLHGVRNHPDYGLELVDYKVLPTSPEENHLLPLALNALILSALKPELSFAMGMESFSPDCAWTAVSHDTINHLLRERVVPTFYELVRRPAPADLKNPHLEFVKTPTAAVSLT
jgi:hypothetical protein